MSLLDDNLEDKAQESLEVCFTPDRLVRAFIGEIYKTNKIVNNFGLTLADDDYLYTRANWLQYIYYYIYKSPELLKSPDLCVPIFYLGKPLQYKDIKKYYGLT
jgi:hypothetical protein